MLLRSLIHLAPAAALIGLAACAGGLGGSADFVLTRENIRPAYVPDNFRFFHGGKTMPVVVHGRALGADADELAAALADHLDGHSPAARTDFVASSPAEAGESRLVVQVAPPPPLLARDICDGSKVDDTAQTSATDGVSEFLFAYCVRDRDQSAIRLATRAESPQDPAFARGAAVAAQRIFPVRDPDTDPGCRVPNTC